MAAPPQAIVLLVLVSACGALGVCTGLCAGMLAPLAPSASENALRPGSRTQQLIRSAWFGVLVGSIVGLLLGMLVYSEKDKRSLVLTGLGEALQLVLPLSCLGLAASAFCRLLHDEYQELDPSWAIAQAHRESHAPSLVVVRADELVEAAHLVRHARAQPRNTLGPNREAGGFVLLFILTVECAQLLAVLAPHHPLAALVLLRPTAPDAWYGPLTAALALAAVQLGRCLELGTRPRAAFSTTVTGMARHPTV